jgi:hypothetical protein
MQNIVIYIILFLSILINFYLILEISHYKDLYRVLNQELQLIHNYNDSLRERNNLLEKNNK